MVLSKTIVLPDFENIDVGSDCQVQIGKQVYIEKVAAHSKYTYTVIHLGHFK